MIKQGSFCCWEAVLAATAASPQSKEIKAYIEELVGCELIPAPSHTELSWLSESGTITTIDQFLGACEVPLKPVQVVEVGVDGRLTHCVLARRAWMGFAHRFTTTRKKGKEKAFEVLQSSVRVSQQPQEAASSICALHRARFDFSHIILRSAFLSALNA